MLLKISFGVFFTPPPNSFVCFVQSSSGFTFYMPLLISLLYKNIINILQEYELKLAL